MCSKEEALTEVFLVGAGGGGPLFLLSLALICIFICFCVLTKLLLLGGGFEFEVDVGPSIRKIETKKVDYDAILFLNNNFRNPTMMPKPHSVAASIFKSSVLCIIFKVIFR